MNQSDIKTCVVFRSDLFNVDWPDDEHGVESMAELGKDCAEFLMEPLRSLTSISCITDAEPNDWGWFFCATIAQERYAIFILGAMAPPPVDWWVVQVLPLGFCWWLFRRPRTYFPELLEIIDHVLMTTDGISDVTWMTVEEYLQFNVRNDPGHPSN